MSKDTALFLVIVMLIAMIVLNAVSAKGMYQYACRRNASTFMYFLYNLMNSLLFGIPGLMSAYGNRNVTFAASN